MQIPEPQYKEGDRVIYRIESADEVFDIKSTVIEPVYTEAEGWKYHLALNPLFACHIISSDRISPDFS